MKITEYKEVTERKLVTLGYRCDNCGKTHSGKHMPDDWHEFSGHHNSWGNPSGQFNNGLIYFRAQKPLQLSF